MENTEHGLVVGCGYEAQVEDIQLGNASADTLGNERRGREGASAHDIKVLDVLSVPEAHNLELAGVRASHRDLPRTVDDDIIVEFSMSGASVMEGDCLVRN